MNEAVLMRTGRWPESADNAVTAYLKWRRENSTLSPRTLRDYSETLHRVLQIMGELSLHTYPTQINAKDIKALLASMEKDGYTVATRRSYLHILRAWTEYYGNNIIRRMGPHWPHDDRPTVDWLSLDQANELLRTPMTPMQELAVHCELCLGLRRREVVRLVPENIHLDAGYLDLVGKGSMGGKPRRLPFHPDTARVIERYVSYRNTLIAETRAAARSRPVIIPDRLLIYRRGRTLCIYNSDSCSGFDKAVKENLNKKLSFKFGNHTLRRTFGREMHRAGVDLLTICKLMGHESVDQTIKYLGLNMDDMMAGMRMSPFRRR